MEAERSLVLQKKTILFLSLIITTLFILIYGREVNLKESEINFSKINLVTQNLENDENEIVRENVKYMAVKEVQLNENLNISYIDDKKIEAFAGDITNLIDKKENEIVANNESIKNEEIIALETNKREQNNQTTAHAEILAIEKACKKLKSWRLDDCDLYVTLEPCPMCAGAIVNARIKNVFFAVADPENGGHSRFNLFENCMNHSSNCIQIKEFEQENKQLIQKFFKNKRQKKR